MALFDTLAGMTVLGGILIGLACGILTLLTGRVMSASGMIGSLLGGAEGVAATSIAFIGGLVAAPFVLSGFGIAQRDVTEAGLPLLITGGFLVGVSARLGGASLGGLATGIARGVPRSIVMLAVMLVGATVGGTLQVLFVAGAAA